MVPCRLIKKHQKSELLVQWRKSEIGIGGRVEGNPQQQKIKGIRARRKKIGVRDGLVWSSKEAESATDCCCKGRMNHR